MLNIEEIEKRILSGEQIEEIIKNIDWRSFEKLIGSILEKHNFYVNYNFRFKTRNRYEIDILAIKFDKILVIDCKHWGKGRYKKSSLKAAVKNQLKRLKELKKFLQNNPIAQQKLKIKYESVKFITLIVTWFEEELIEYKNILIVPIWKLNDFLLNLSNYI